MRVTIEARPEDIMPDTIIQYVHTALREYFEDNKNELLRLERMRSAYDGDIIIPFIVQEDMQQKVYVNLAKTITDTATNHFIGDPVSISTTDENENEALERNMAELDKQNFHTNLFAVAKDVSKFGKGYSLVFSKKGELYPRMIRTSPQNTFVVYDNSIEQNSLFAVYFTKEKSFARGGMYAREFYRITVYDRFNVYYLESQDTDFHYNFWEKPDKVKWIDYQNLHYNLAIKTAKPYFPHGFGRVPITEFRNNFEMKGDYEDVLPSILAYSILQSQRIDNVQKIIASVLLLKNVDLGDEDQVANAQKYIKKYRILSMKDVGDKDADAKFLTNVLDQTQTQVLLKSIKEDIDMVSKVPSLTSTEFTQSVSGSALGYKTLGLEQLTKEKERLFNIGLNRIFKMFNTFFANHSLGEYMLDIGKLRFSYKHRLPSDDMQVANMAVSLANVGVDIKEALGKLSFMTNVDKALEDGIERVERLSKAKMVGNVYEEIDGSRPQMQNELNLSKPKESKIALENSHANMANSIETVK